MRTTVELPDEIRARLLEMAARRGERGFSALVEEARSALGTLSADAADELEESVLSLRACPSGWPTTS